MPTIQLRHDETLSLVKSIKSGSDMTIFAPRWVKMALDEIARQIDGVSFEIADRKHGQLVKAFTVDKDAGISLQQLQMMARNEQCNVTGVINFELYLPDIKNRKIIYSIKDLVKFCVMVGKQKTTHYGGYPRVDSRVPQSDTVYICNLIGLQFQQSYNSGRLVLVGASVPTGHLDSFIYEQVVGETRPTASQCEKDATNRFVRIEDDGGDRVYFDTLAYKKIVAQDVVLVGAALEQVADGDVNFKFLKYGTGFFAGSYRIRRIVNQFITDGLAEGVRALFVQLRPKKIKRIELCHYGDSPTARLQEVCKEFGIELHISSEDALKKTSDHLITAATNCADPHAVFGNEMGMSSVDAMIAENLEGKGHVFNPCLNSAMKSVYIDIDLNLVKFT